MNCDVVCVFMFIIIIINNIIIIIITIIINIIIITIIIIININAGDYGPTAQQRETTICLGGGSGFR